MTTDVKSFLTESLMSSSMEDGPTQTLYPKTEEELGSLLRARRTDLISTLLSGINLVKGVLQVSISPAKVKEQVLNSLEMGDGGVDLMYAASTQTLQEVMNVLAELERDLKDS